jgi:hypothetical protein
VTVTVDASYKTGSKGTCNKDQKSNLGSLLLKN